MKLRKILETGYYVAMLACFGYGYNAALNAGDTFWVIGTAIGMLAEVVLIYSEFIEASGLTKEDNSKKEEG